MNLHLLLKRLIGKPTCVLGEQTRLAHCARILNAGGKSSLIRVGRHCVIEGELFVFGHGGEIEIGDWCFVGPGTRIWSASAVTIKNRVLISHNVNIFDSLTHPLNPERRHAQFKEIVTSGHPREICLDERPVIIEEDAWIGAGAIIMRGVRVGARSVVGAGSVVTVDVPDDAIVAGNPARLVRQLNETDEGK
jgi:acetyltransferase-like isoleucine patch superfamily enzyme